MTRLRGLAWDIDGTLADSEGLHQRALLAGSGALGADLSDLPEGAFRGVHMLDVWTALEARMPAGVAREDWLAAIERYYVAHRAEVAPMPFAIETVRALSARGIAQGCVSNSSRAVVDANLEALGVADHFAFSLSLDDVVAGKPDPAPYREACRRLALPPEAVAAVEDSRAGVESARRAGLFTVGYRSGGPRFEAVDLVVDRLDEALSLFPARDDAAAARRARQTIASLVTGSKK